MSKKSNQVAVKAPQQKAKWYKNKKYVAAAIIGAAALATAIVLVLVFVFDLGPVHPINSTSEQAKAVGTVDGFEVRYEELRYVVSINKMSLDAKYGKYDTLSDNDKQSYDSELEALVLEDIKSNYAILSLCKKYSVDTDSKQANEYVNDAIESFVDEIGGKQQYKEWLAKNKLTDAFLRLMYKVGYLETVLVDKLSQTKDHIKYSEDDLSEFVDYVMEDDSYIKVIHAYYPKDWKYADGKDALVNASSALSKIQTAESGKERFSRMKYAIGTAPFVSGYSVTGSDYYITYGQMHEDYEKMAFSLEEYEVSSILELEEGYYILMRVQKNEDEVGPRAVELLANYGYAVLKQLADEQKEGMSFVGNDYFDSLDLAQIK